MEAIALLLEPLRVAIEGKRVVVALGMWRRIEPIALLPFQLHGPWCDRIPVLPLNASFTLVPFTPNNWAAAREALYDPSEVYMTRRQARIRRHEPQPRFSGDFEPPDWERGYVSHRDELAEKPLPGCSFLSVEVVQPGGCVRSWPRPVLGRFAVRDALRPRLLVPSRRCSSENRDALSVLVTTDVLILDLQEVRGKRTYEFVQAVLMAARGKDRPTLIIAASPTDLLFSDDFVLPAEVTIMPIGDIPITPLVSTVLVGRERPQLEREFDLTLRQLRCESQLHDHLVQLGLSAWWAANQSLVDDPDADHSIRRFLAALDRLAVSGAREVIDFNAFRGLLLRTLADRERIEERAFAVERVVENHLNTGMGSVTIVVRQSASARILAERIAKRINCDPRDLQEWGVRIRSGRAFISGEEPGLVVTCGFSGFTSIDAILASRAPQATLVVDPVEASLAVRSARRIAQWLARASVPEAAVTAVAASAKSVAIRSDGLKLGFAFDVFQPIVPPHFPMSSRHVEAEKQRFLITFADGDVILVDAGRRFELINPTFGASRTVPASSLSPGDEVVLTEGTALFSERLIASLDDGILSKEAMHRKTWVMMINALVTTRKLKKAEIHQQLASAGVHVDYATVRAWTSLTEDDDRVPARWEHFRALAEVVGIALPEPELRDLFDAVRTLRVRHRKAGRDIVRMMLAARVGRLDPVTLKRVETAFGLSVRELVEATRVAVIDDVQSED